MGLGELISGLVGESAALKRTLKRNPNDVDLMRKIAELELKEEHHDEARTYLLKTLERGCIYQQDIVNLLKDYYDNRPTEADGVIKEVLSHVASILRQEIDTKPAYRIEWGRVAWYVSLCEQYELVPVISRDELPGRNRQKHETASRQD